MTKEKPAILPVVWVLALFNLVLSSAMIVGIPIIVVNVLGMSDASLGLTQGAMGLGGLAGGCLAGITASGKKPLSGYRLLVACALSALLMGLALTPAFSPQAAYILITAMVFAAMAASTLFTIQMSTIVQRQTPLHLVGKIMSVIICAAMCAQPIGQALYGFLFETFAYAPWAVVTGGAAAAFLIAIYSKKAFLKLEES